MLIQRNQKKKESINVNSKGLEKKGKYKPWSAISSYGTLKT